MADVQLVDVPSGIGLRIRLQSEDVQVSGAWEGLFGGWLAPATGADTADIGLHLTLTESLPSPPDSTPFFVDRQPPDGTGLRVYHGEDDGMWLYYPGEALVSVPLDHEQNKAIGMAAGMVTPLALANGRFEDLTITALAPLLRRQGYYLIHAFAASSDGVAVLFVGPSGSGKTTTGLSLVLAGWQLLGNDVVLLAARAGVVYACSTPGTIRVRPATLELLPQLQSRPGLRPRQPRPEPQQPAVVTAVYFPQIQEQSHSTRQSLNRAVGLARLMEASIDRWDEASLMTHVNLLQRLSWQTAAYELHLGTDVANLPYLLAR